MVSSVIMVHGGDAGLRLAPKLAPIHVLLLFLTLPVPSHPASSSLGRGLTTRMVGILAYGTDAALRSPPHLASIISVCLATSGNVTRACGDNADCPQTHISMQGDATPCASSQCQVDSKSAQGPCRLACSARAPTKALYRHLFGPVKSTKA